MSTATDVYPSRVKDEPDVMQRKDPVVYCDSREVPDPSLKDKLKFFDRNGYLFLDNLFSADEVDTFRAEVEMLKNSNILNGHEGVIREPGSNAVRSIFQMHAISEVFGPLCADRRLLKIVTAILNSDAYIHQSRINLKPAFRGKDFYWHSDFETWHVEDGMPRMRAVSCSILLTDNNPFNSPLMVLPGSHRRYIACTGRTPSDNYKQSLKKQEYGVPDGEILRDMADRTGIKAPTGKAGSVLLFDCNLMHGSSSNISPWPRSNLFFVYNSVENKLETPFGGVEPRPEFIASREDTETLEPCDLRYRDLI